MKFCINSMLCLTFLCHARIYCGGGSVAAAAEEAEQVKKQVDEVKIEIQGAESGYMAGGRRARPQCCSTFSPPSTDWLSA